MLIRIALFAGLTALCGCQTADDRAWADYSRGVEQVVPKACADNSKIDEK